VHVSTAGLPCNSKTGSADPSLPNWYGLGAWEIRHVKEPPASAFRGTGWSDGSFSVRAELDNPDRFLVSFANSAEFLVDFAKTEILVHCLDSYSQQGLRHLLDDQILPRILAHQGELVLHAAGVADADGVILFMGVSGSGKSSLAAAIQIRLLRSFTPQRS